ncbi:MAG: TetR family transcriptional regulator [Myxococcota bacterium]
MASISEDRSIHSVPRTETLATRLRILRAAERLFSEAGIDAVALHQIGREAGQRNRSAVQYHFGDKQGLLVAILDRHTPSIGEHRNHLLDEIEERGETRDLHRLAEAFVLPVVRKARDPDGGMAYVRIAAQLIGHPRYTLFRLDQQRGRAGSRRLQRLVTAAGPEIPRPLRLPRTLTATGLLFHGIADWSRIVEERSGRIAEADWSGMTSHLVDAAAAQFAMPVAPSRGRQEP